MGSSCEAGQHLRAKNLHAYRGAAGRLDCIAVALLVRSRALVSSQLQSQLKPSSTFAWRSVRGLMVRLGCWKAGGSGSCTGMHFLHTRVPR